MVWQHRRVSGARVFGVMLAASVVWSFTRLLEAGVIEYWAKIFWGKTEYFGILVVSPAWFIFTRNFAFQSKTFPLRRVLLLAIVPLITLVLVWTNEAHHLIWTSITTTSNPEILNYEHGAWFWLVVAYNYSLLIGGIWNLITALMSLPTKYRLQVKALLLGSIAPIIGNFLYIVGLSPIAGMDITPLCLTVTAAVYFLAVFRYQLFDLQHVARDTIIENMRDGMLLIDEKDRIVDVNPSALALLGLPKTMVDHDMRTSLSRYPEIIAAITTPQPHPITLTIGDAVPRHIDIQVSSLEDELGNLAGKLVVLRDVTERFAAQKIAFENAVEQHRTELLAQFIRNVSHEYRTPLTIINTSLYLMEKSNDPAQQKNRREIIQRQTQRLDYLIDEMLTLIKLDSNVALDHIRLDVNNLLQTVMQEQSPAYAAKQQFLSLQQDNPAALLYGDEHLLKKALTHILQNANLYTPEGGTVTVHVSVEDSFAAITVRDSGIGMNAETQSHLFERFYRADAAHSTPGFGLGLSIVQSIVEKHDGYLEVESAAGMGTTLTLFLPCIINEAIMLPERQLAAV